MNTKLVLKERYGGRWGRQKPDAMGRRWRIKVCPHVSSHLCWDVEYLRPHEHNWVSYWSAVDSFQAALDRVAYKRNFDTVSRMEMRSR